jgi:hypothetical protein
MDLWNIQNVSAQERSKVFETVFLSNLFKNAAITTGGWFNISIFIINFLP